MPMIDDWILSLIYAAWLAGSTLPLGLMLGSSCSPCCGSQGCEVADGKPRTDPVNEGTWTPSGTWRGVGGVTWTFTANPGDDSGETWFFFGSLSTSKVGGGASTTEQQDWGNICNWYSSKTNAPNVILSVSSELTKRASRLPPENAVVQIYTPVSTAGTGPKTVKAAYFWASQVNGTVTVSRLVGGSELTTTNQAHDSDQGAVFVRAHNGSFLSSATVNGGAKFVAVGNVSSTRTENYGEVNGGGEFVKESGTASNALNFGTVNDKGIFRDGTSHSAGTVNGGAEFYDTSLNDSVSVVNDEGKFYDSSRNQGVTNDGAQFFQSAKNFGTVNGGAFFNDSSRNSEPTFSGVVNGGAEFNDSALNFAGTVNNGATFNDSSQNAGTVNGGAEFNGSAEHGVSAVVNGGATFNDAACSRRNVGSFFASPCTRQFVAHPTDLPTCNGTALAGCVNAGTTCGCG